MTRHRVIKQLAAELANLIGRNDSIEIIEHYIQAAIVSELERLKLDIGIFQKIDPKTGIILGEYLGVDEIYEELKSDGIYSCNYDTCQKAINRSVIGERPTAYGYLWKKI